MRLIYFIAGVYFAVKSIESILLIGTTSFHGDALAISLVFSFLLFFLLYGNYQNSLKSKNKNKQNSVNVTHENETVPIDISGESFYQDALIRVIGEPNQDGYEVTINGLLVRDPQNEHDSNAVKCLIHGNIVGYVNRQEAKDISRYMDANNIQELLVACDVTGGWNRGKNDRGMFGVTVNVPNRFLG